MFFEICTYILIFYYYILIYVISVIKLLFIYLYSDIQYLRFGGVKSQMVVELRCGDFRIRFCVEMSFSQYWFQIQMNIIIMSAISLSCVWVAVISRLIWTIKLLLNDYHNENKHYPISNHRNELSMIPSLFHILWLLLYF